MKKSLNDKIESGALSGLIPTGQDGESRDMHKMKKAARDMKKADRIGKRGRPRRTDKDNLTAPSAERGTKPGEARKTYLVDKALAEALEFIAWYDRRKGKEVLRDMMSEYVVRWEKNNGRPAMKDAGGRKK